MEDSHASTAAAERGPALAGGPDSSSAKTDRLDRVIREHQGAVWRYLRYLGANEAEAEDLTQETFVEVARRGFEERHSAATAAYLRAVARNALFQARRRERRAPRRVELDQAERVWAATVAPTDGAGDSRWSLLVDAARACAESLAGRPRDAIRLCYAEHASRESIAERLGMTPDGVKTLLRRTRASLRKCIERRAG